MREIIFRGKRVDSGEWVEGWLLKYEYNKMYIHKYYSVNENIWRQHEVYPETIGQFTGLTDRNGNKIFEDDVIRVDYESQYKVLYKVGGFFISEKVMLAACNDISEVIGNIHDNPELIK